MITGKNLKKNSLDGVKVLGGALLAHLLIENMPSKGKEYAPEIITGLAFVAHGTDNDFITRVANGSFAMGGIRTVGKYVAKATKPSAGDSAGTAGLKSTLRGMSGLGYAPTYTPVMAPRLEVSNSNLAGGRLANVPVQHSRLA